jgi:predicted amidohydrolase
MKVSVIQLEISLADVPSNLDRAAASVRDACHSGAELVLLPEFFTSGMAFEPSLLQVPLHQTETRSFLLASAREFSVPLGGSFLTFDGSNAHNTFVLACPDGTIFTHRKDLPTMVENAFYAPGDDDGILDTPIGRIGIALCWEMIRTQTVRRLSGRVDFALAASCWWGHCLPYDPAVEQVQLCNEQLLQEAPRELARLLGVPVAHASSVGQFEAATLSRPHQSFCGRFLGHSQLVGPDGVPIAALESQSAVLVSELPLQTSAHSTKTASSGYWTLPPTESHIRAWEREARLGRDYYSVVALPRYKVLFGRRGGSS